MGNFLSKKPKVTDTDRTILTLKTQRQKLTTYQKQLDKVIVREVEIARELLQQKRKDRALLTLKRKKAQEELLQKVDVWILNVEQQLADIETATRQKAVYDSLKAGHRAIQDLQKEINVEDIQKLLDDTEEARTYQDEIKAVLGEKLTDEDEEAVLGELEALEFEMGLEEFPEAPTRLPEVPATPTKEEKRREEARREEPIAEPADGLIASGRSRRSVPSNANNNDEALKVSKSSSQSRTAEDELDDDLDLPAVPTIPVKVHAAPDSTSKSEVVPTKERELLPA